MLGKRKARRRASRSSCPGVVYQSRLCLGGLGAFPHARLQLGSGTRACWFCKAPRGDSRNDLGREEQPGQQNTCSDAQTLWAESLQAWQGNCAASTGDCLCQVRSGPEVRAPALTFGISCLKLWSCGCSLCRVHSKFYLENIQPPHQEGVPGSKGWLLQFELMSALSTAASPMHGHALPCRTCILHSRSFQKWGVPDFLDGDVDV